MRDPGPLQRLRGARDVLEPLRLRQPFTPHTLHLKPGWASHFPSVMPRGHRGFKEIHLLWYAKIVSDRMKIIIFVCVKFFLTFHILYNSLGFSFYLTNKSPKTEQRQKLARLFLWETAVKPVPPAMLFSIHNFQPASLLCEKKLKSQNLPKFRT